jgi:putative oxidoreductase
MNSTRADWLALMGRTLPAILFLNTAIGWIGNLQGPINAAANVGVPVANIAVPLALVIMVVGSLCLIAGFYARLGALGLLVFTLLAFIFFHRYWEKPAAAAAGDKVHFFKDLALCGNFLYIMAFGAGGISLDARRSR